MINDNTFKSINENNHTSYKIWINISILRKKNGLIYHSYLFNALVSQIIDKDFFLQLFRLNKECLNAKFIVKTPIASSYSWFIL
jgi:hypothetical protein